jgi:protease-4
MRRLGRILLGFLAFVGFATLAVTGLGVWGLVHFAEKMEPAVPRRAVLTLDLDAKFQAAGEANPLAALSSEKTYSLRKVVEAIDHAALDPRVTGLFATIGHASLGMAGAQEIRDSVGRFRATGKPAVLFAETLGEFGAGTLDTYLASGFGQVWLQPSGDVGLTGVLAESPFFKGTFDLLGVKPEFSGRYEFKSAIDIFTETKFTPAHRENLGRMLDSWTAQLVEGIAAGRKLPPDKVQALLGKGPFLPAEALSAGLVDQIGYREAALRTMTGEGGGGEAADTKGADATKELDLTDYSASLGKDSGAKVALISGIGTIHRGESQRGFGPPEDFGATTVSQAFREAVKDKDVKAILFRVDSPGGSYTASDTVWHEVKRAREAGKPVVVSMGDVAASGGYFVAMGADRVLAEPGTITGSIGVFSGKFVLEDLWKKIGVSWDEMHRGDNAPMWSANRPFSPEAWERMNTMLDAIYLDFTAKAADGRHLAKERMDEVARGRVWTGADAKALGLVDVLGGWHEAMQAVREVAKLTPEAPVALVAFPRPKKPWEMLAEALGGGAVDESGSVRSALRSLRLLEPLLARLALIAQPEGAAALRLPPELEAAHP